MNQALVMFSGNGRASWCEVVKRNPKTVWVRSPTGRIVKRKIRRDVLRWA